MHGLKLRDLLPLPSSVSDAVAVSRISDVSLLVSVEEAVEAVEAVEAPATALLVRGGVQGTLRELETNVHTKVRTHCDCKIFVNLRLTFVSSSRPCWAPCRPRPVCRPDGAVERGSALSTTWVHTVKLRGPSIAYQTYLGRLADLRTGSLDLLMLAGVLFPGPGPGA